MRNRRSLDHAGELPAALLMAGGQSSRMRKNGDKRHKALRTVLGRPLLAWNLSALVSFGFRDIYIAYNRSESALADWVDSEAQALARDAGAHCTALVEGTRLGTIGAAACLPETVGHVLVTNVDNLSDLPLAALAHYHLASGAAATLATHTEPFRIPFGRLELAGDVVLGYSEKPAIPVPICSGTTVLSRRAIARINTGSSMHLPALIQSLLQEGERVCAFSHHSHWIDINDEGALAAAEALMRANAGCWPGAGPFDPDLSTVEHSHA
jgi:NDP-sugar pyrophosphorylase family protein